MAQYPGSNLTDDMESLVAPELSELEGIEKPVVATLENMIVFTTRHREIERELEELDRYAATLKVELTTIEEKNLPQILEALGMSDYGLKDGSRIELEGKFQGALVVKDLEQRKRQLDWLVKNEGQDLIKNTFTLTFPKGKDEEAKALRELLSEYDFDFTVEESVHASSLGSFIKEKVQKGHEIPFDVLKWRYFQKAKIKEPPKPRASAKKVKQGE